MSNPLFTPLQIGSIPLHHRVVMAPLTRMRATADGAEPTALHTEYYGQRSSPGGLLISEATQVTAHGKGFPRTPGIHTDAQEAGWVRVTRAVHARGGHMFLQIYHTGRVSHSSHLPGGDLPVAPSAIAATGMALGADFASHGFEIPRALTTDEVPHVVEAFRQAAARAMRAGFDGVEVHAANGFLIDQFLHDGSNHRDDRYGGSIENRSRFLFEVLEAVTQICTPARVGLRLSPFGTLGGVHDAAPQQLFDSVIHRLSRTGLAYLHLVEPRANAGQTDTQNLELPASAAALFRKSFDGPLIASGGFNAASASRMLQDGHADAIAFGRAFIANPDLPQRLKTGSALTPYDRSTFYGGQARGYTDYQSMANSQ